MSDTHIDLVDQDQGLESDSKRWVLTRHLQAVVQDGEQAGVGFCVLQLPVNQLKHLRGTFCVNVDLGEFRPQ